MIRATVKILGGARDLDARGAHPESLLRYSLFTAGWDAPPQRRGRGMHVPGRVGWVGVSVVAEGPGSGGDDGVVFTTALYFLCPVVALSAFRAPCATPARACPPCLGDSKAGAHLPAIGWTDGACVRVVTGRGGGEVVRRLPSRGGVGGVTPPSSTRMPQTRVVEGQGPADGCPTRMAGISSVSGCGGECTVDPLARVATCECGRHTFMVRQSGQSAPSAKQMELGDTECQRSDADLQQRDPGPRWHTDGGRAGGGGGAHGEIRGFVCTDKLGLEQHNQGQQQLQAEVAPPPSAERSRQPMMDIENLGRGVLVPNCGGSGRKGGAPAPETPEGQDVAECGPSGWPLERIAVDRQGNFVLLEPSVVCDACPACEDTCRLAKCRGCEDKRRALGRLGPVQQQGRGAGAAAGARQLKEYAYTLCEVRRHRTLASCWLVAKGQVYDVTPYLAHHPAGAVAIARKAGGLDCTEDLEFHSPRAQKLWRQFRIGVVKACPGNHGYGHGHGPRVSGASVSQGQGQGQGGLCGGGEAGATPSAFAASGPDALDGPSICSVM